MQLGPKKWTVARLVLCLKGVVNVVKWSAVDMGAVFTPLHINSCTLHSEQRSKDGKWLTESFICRRHGEENTNWNGIGTLSQTLQRIYVFYMARHSFCLKILQPFGKAARWCSG